MKSGINSICQKFFFLFLMVSIFQSCDNSSNSNDKEMRFNVEPAWNLTAEFQSPESVLYDAEREMLYVSNGVGYSKNGKGFISKVSLLGEVIELKWIENLNRPTGMAIHNNQLFVADIDALKVIEIDQSVLSNQFLVKTENPMLNDVAISSQGIIYVTSSGHHGVYQLEQDSLILAFQEDSLLQYANGIAFKENELMVAGWNLVSCTVHSNIITPLPNPQKIYDFDGLVVDNHGNSYVSQVANQGKLWLFDNAGYSELIFTHANYLADFSLGKISGITHLFLATGDHKQKEYGVLALKIER